MTRTILSVCDFELSTTRPFADRPDGGYNTKFCIPAVEKGKFATLAVKDMFDRFYMMERQYSTVPVYGDHIAEDIFKEWTGNMTTPPPGVLVIAGDAPTQAEIDRAMMLHTIHCEALRREAHEMWIQGKQREAAQEQFKRASLWLGYGDDPWVRKPRVTTLVACPWCRKEIDGEAAVCPECGKVANFEKYKQLEAMQEQILAKAKPAADAPPPPAPPQPVKPQFPTTNKAA